MSDLVKKYWLVSVMKTLQWHHGRLSEKNPNRIFLTEDILENLFQIHVTVEDLEQNNKMNYCKLPKLNEKDSLIVRDTCPKSLNY